MKQNYLFTFLIGLLAILLVTVSLLFQSALVVSLSWGVMALSLGVTLFTLIRNDRQRFSANPVRLRRSILVDTAGLLLSTAAAMLAGWGVIELVQNRITHVTGAAVLVCLVLSFAVGLGVAWAVNAGWKKVTG